MAADTYTAAASAGGGGTVGYLFSHWNSGLFVFLAGTVITIQNLLWTKDKYFPKKIKKNIGAITTASECNHKEV